MQIMHHTPHTTTGLFKDLAFLGGELSMEDFQILHPKSSKIDFTKECSENLSISSGLEAFEDMHRCTVWVQSFDDIGRINLQNKVVYDKNNSTRKIFFAANQLQ